VSRSAITVLVTLGGLLGAVGWQAVAAAPPPRVDPREAPHYDPAHFTTRIDNAWFPLKPGIRYVYRGIETDGHTRDVVTVTRRTLTIQGVECRVVHDDVFLDGVLAETTEDYYTQDVDGNVWYFGEDTAELDRHGNVTNTDGSFRAGVDGGQAGVFMQAHPQLGRKFRQEWYQGQAEDVYEALSTSATRSVPYGTFTNVLRTRETNALEPGVRDNKYYARGIGSINELTVHGGNERLDLVDILR